MSYTSKDIKTLEGLEAIKLRPHMYIGTTDTNGMHHLLLEIISNSIDEALNGHGERITITIDSTKNSAMVEDGGRGIPFGPMSNGKEAMIELFTNLNSGGKFGQGGYSVSGGLHGIGGSAVNALSIDFKAQSTRDGKRAILTCSDGFVKDFSVAENLKDSRGSLVYFIPNSKVFDGSKWDKERIINTIRQLSYLTTGVKFVLKFDNDIQEFLSTEGMKDLIKEKTNGLNNLSDIVYLKTEANKMMVEIAFQFTDGAGERIFAFTNNIPNGDGGTHVTGFKTSLTNYINSKAKELGLLQSGDENLSGDGIRRGIFAAVSIKMSETPQFTNQTKDKLQNPSARTAVSSGMSSLSISRKDLEVVIKKALLEKKAEDAAKRAREAAKKVVSGGKSMSMLRDLPEKLIDASGSNAELFIVEGDSAGGSAESGRDPKKQAILSLRGKVLNTISKELSEIVENKEIQSILTSLGCGIGEKFNINNLRYEKIVMMADADPDGQHINVLLSTLFLIHLPELILQGKVFRAVPPLFRAKVGTKVTYIQDDSALVEFKKKHKGVNDITRFKGLGEMSSQELWDTTMNPETRVLVQLTTKDLESTLDLFDTLMGASAAKRREYIMEHAKDLL